VSELSVQLLPEFDHIFVGVLHVADEVSQIVGVPCRYLPLAADVLRFSPYPDLPVRTINVCNIGRRSGVTHAALRTLARERRLFHYYDTVAASSPGRKQRTFQVSDPVEHRFLLGNLLRRGRYYIANRARFNETEITMGRDEISSRFYEGAAAGTVMLGEPPRSSVFEAQFDWPNALIRFHLDSTDIALLLAELGADPERLSRVQRSTSGMPLYATTGSIVFATFSRVLASPPAAEMVAREEQLRALAGLAADAGVGRALGSSGSAERVQPTSTPSHAVLRRLANAPLKVEADSGAFTSVKECTDITRSAAPRPSGASPSSPDASARRGFVGLRLDKRKEKMSCPNPSTSY
jgi:hypothetical protein